MAARMRRGGTADSRQRGTWPARLMVAAAAVVPAVLVVGSPAAFAVSPAPAPGVLQVVAGNGTEAETTAGPGTSTGLLSPGAVAVDAAGDLYIANTGQNQVDEVTPAGVLSIVAGDGANGAPAPGPATNSHLGNPTGVAVDAAGNVYITVGFDQVVVKVTPAGVLSIIAGTGVFSAPTPGPATTSGFLNPDGVAVDASGNVYIADSESHEVAKVTPGGTLSIFAGTGVSGAPTPGPATGSDLASPEGLAVDSAGDVYIADGANDVVEKVTPAGILSVIAGNGTAGAWTPGPATSSDLLQPQGVAVDAAGDVYVADTQSDVVLRVTPAGTLSDFAGSGASGAGHTPTGGPAASEDLQIPQGLAADAAGDVYIADTFNNLVEEVGAVAPPSSPPPSSPPPSSPPPSATAAGYTLVGSDGGVFAFGDASFEGSLPGLGVAVNDIKGIVPSADDHGYFLVGSDGGVFAFGDTSFENSLPGLGVKVANIVGIVPSADDKGYFLVGSDGGVFAFGDASFEGSLPGIGVSVNDIVSISATPDNKGYWLLGADGSTYAFGDAAPLGTAAPGSVAIVADPAGGAWVVGSNGSVTAFGGAGSFGNLPALGVAVSNIVSLVPTANGGGYWLIGSDGGLFSFGNASFQGSLPNLGIHVNNIIGAVPAA